jgi:hypothetical protein
VSYGRRSLAFGLVGVGAVGGGTTFTLLVSRADPVFFLIGLAVLVCCPAAVIFGIAGLVRRSRGQETSALPAVCGLLLGAAPLALLASSTLTAFSLGRRVREEVGAANALRSILTSQNMVRANDADRDGVAEYWIRDVAGLRFHQPPGAPPLDLIASDIALADADGLAAYGKGTPVPCGGYFFRTLRCVQRPGAADSMPGRFAVCAYPERWKPGRRTLVVDESGTIRAADLGAEGFRGPQEWVLQPGPEWKILDSGSR